MDVRESSIDIPFKAPVGGSWAHCVGLNAGLWVVLQAK